LTKEELLAIEKRAEAARVAGLDGPFGDLSALIAHVRELEGVNRQLEAEAERLHGTVVRPNIKRLERELGFADD